MSNPNFIEETNLSRAWIKTFINKYENVGNEGISVTTITNLNNDSVSELSEVKELLDSYLVGRKEQCIENVAFTIFPNSYWNRSRDRQLLYKRFLNVWPRLKKYKLNCRGNYFYRMVNYTPKGETEIKDIVFENQLEHIINTWTKYDNHRFTALQIPIFNPFKDHVNSEQLGFPCLQQVSFKPLGVNGQDGLEIIGYYPNQLLFEKAYGNYLGLCHLGQFIAQEIGLEFKKMTCITLKSTLYKKKKGSILDFYSNLKKII